MTRGPLSAYRALRGAGTIEPDAAQARAAEALEGLYRALAARRAQRRWPFRFRRAPEAPPRSLYLHGGVGRGKTMLMDLFHAAAAAGSGSAPARRTHFHAFMADVHARLHAWRKAGGGRADPVPPLAAALAREARLLCFDEFEVRDIADAMILSRLFKALLDAGTVVVSTSNRAPQALYADGLQRDRFLPFIALVEDRFDVLHLDGPVDWRLRGMARSPVWFAPLGPTTERALNEAFARLVGGAEIVREILRVQGHDVVVPAANGTVARFSFADLYAQPLGAADYLAIAARYRTVFVAGIPKLAPEDRNEARRFAVSIDIFYDRGVKLIASADAEPEALYPAGTGAFEFRRAASRLAEMRAPAYLARPAAAPAEGKDERAGPV